MTEVRTGQSAPEMNLTSLDGSRLHLESFRGKPVLLNFFNSTCPWCQSEMPRLAQVYDRVMQQGIHMPIIGIVVGSETSETAQQFAQHSELHIPIALDNTGTVSADFGITRVPTLVLLDAQGMVARVYEGASEQLTGIVEQAIYAADRGNEAPTFEMVGNGCAAN